MNATQNPFIQFTDRARKVMSFARQCADEKKISPLHVLFGLFKETSSIALVVLKNAGVNLEEFFLAVRDSVTEFDASSEKSESVTFMTAEAEAIVLKANELAAELNAEGTDTFDLLVALTMIESPAQKLLANVGITSKTKFHKIFQKAN